MSRVIEGYPRPLNVLRHNPIFLDQPTNDTSPEELNEIMIEGYRNA